MKSTALILLTLAATGLAAPAYSQASRVAPAKQASAGDQASVFKSLCEESVACQKRCNAAVIAVKDAESAAAAAKVIREEVEKLSSLRKRARAVSMDADEEADPQMRAAADELDKEMDALYATMGAKLHALHDMDDPYYGCMELQDSWLLYVQVVFQGMTPLQATLMMPVVAKYQESDTIRYEAWKNVISVHDRASADAASAALAELMERQNKNFTDLQGLLEQLPEDEVDDFCQVVYQAYLDLCENRGAIPADFASVSKAAQTKMRQLRAAKPAFYGSPDLEERAGNFIMMPR